MNVKCPEGIGDSKLHSLLYFSYREASSHIVSMRACMAKLFGLLERSQMVREHKPSLRDADAKGAELFLVS